MRKNTGLSQPETQWNMKLRACRPDSIFEGASLCRTALERAQSLAVLRSKRCAEVFKKGVPELVFETLARYRGHERSSSSPYYRVVIQQHLQPSPLKNRGRLGWWREGVQAAKALHSKGKALDLTLSTCADVVLLCGSPNKTLLSPEEFVAAFSLPFDC